MQGRCRHCGELEEMHCPGCFVCPEQACVDYCPDLEVRQQLHRDALARVARGEW